MKHKRKFRRADPPDPTCRDEVELIEDYLAGRLNPPVLAALEKHLGQCPDCTAFLNTYKKTIEATKSFLKIQSVKTSSQPLTLRPKRRGLLGTLFWLHLFIANAYLTV
ncbi:MAG TPA: zf-HC2 domain-containing protein [Candidatus Binatia bacterium]|nr:zf-HC2 domain-containing protein [Candidatus Binatia bacterium]